MPASSDVEPAAPATGSARVPLGGRASKEAANRSARGSESTRAAGPVNSTWQNHVCESRPARTSKSKEAARDVNYVPVLNIFWFRWVAVNGRLKVKGLGALFTVDYASEMNIIRAPIVARSACFHNHLIHRRRAIESVYGRLIGKPCHGHACRAVLQRHQHFVVIKLPFVAANKLMLKIDNPLTGRRDFADERQAHLAVPSNFLRLIRDGLVGIGNLDRISGRKPYGCVRTWRIRQRREGGLATAAQEPGQNQQSEKARESRSRRVCDEHVPGNRSIVPHVSSVLHHATLFTLKNC